MLGRVVLDVACLTKFPELIDLYISVINGHIPLVKRTSCYIFVSHLLL